MTTEEEPIAAAPIVPIGSMRKALLEEAWRRDRALKEGRPVGPITGYKPLDDALGGCLNPGLHILHGTPGAGKSALALSFASQCRTPALYISTELSQRVLARRLIARLCGMSMWEVKKLPVGVLNSYYDKVERTMPMFSVMETNKYNVSVFDIRRGIDVLHASYPEGSRSGALVVVDSVHTWATRTYGDKQEYDRLNFALDHLELLAHGAECPILCVAERNRSTKDESGQASAKGSSRFEYAGETVMGIDVIKTDKVRNLGDPFTVGLNISKNRDGICKTILMEWHGATQTHVISDDLPEEGQF